MPDIESNVCTVATIVIRKREIEIRKEGKKSRKNERKVGEKKKKKRKLR
jgi:hypothetical protein